jgi:Aspartyl protease
MPQIPIIVVPDPDDPGCADVRVDIEIDGHPYRCELDTGAARTTLVCDAYLAGLPVRGLDVSAGAFSASSQDLVTIPGLTVGPLSTGSLDVARIEPGSGRSSLLGMDVLGQHCCHFRFDAGFLKLHASPCPAAGLPLPVDNRGHLYMRLNWGDVSGSGCWDSGAGITLVDAGFRQAHPRLFTETGTTVGTDGSGTQAVTPLCLMAGPVIGGVQFGSSQVAVIDMAPMNQDAESPMDMVVGYPTYRQADWIFDVPARRWAAPELLPCGR